MNAVLSKITLSKKTLFAVLIDPDKYNKDVILKSNDVADFFLVGGSSLKNGQLTACLNKIKKLTKLPLIVFPGNTNQLSKNSDATLLLSLVSGRNADYIIGKHVEVALQLKKLKQEIAIASELLGMKLIYLEAGSGAKKSIPSSIIKSVKKNCSLPVIIGGGINNAKKYLEAKNSGADVIVIGNALEKNLSLIDDIKLNK